MGGVRHPARSGRCEISEENLVSDPKPEGDERRNLGQEIKNDRPHPALREQHQISA
jgi:hypothetical protein